MSNSDRGQVVQSAAEVYDEFFVPALFEEWAQRIADAASVKPGQRVLDVATGTGILARTVAERVAPGGSVVGLDINEGMLAVAQRKASQVEWRQGAAESLPFEAESFDAVVSQFGLMFFEDKTAAIREMMRVLRPGGQLTVAVWGRLEESPGYADLAALLERLFGKEAAEALRAPFTLSDVSKLRSILSDAGLSDAKITTHQGSTHFPSIESWMYTEIKGWTLANMLDDAQYQRLVQEAQTILQAYVQPHGGVEFAIPAHIITATIA
jgi:ubiquinone/menaquinone biosynthesis C-methylase UbiE